MYYWHFKVIVLLNAKLVSENIVIDKILYNIHKIHYTL
jgi:hypothetical protein